jgi:hypothetical protein
VFFFPSDSERWIFVLPALSLTLAPLGRSLKPRRSAALLLAIAALNLGLARIPAALDRRPLAQARAVDLALPPGALLVSPGHGWDELIGLATADPPERFPLVYHVGAQGGVGPALRLLHQRIDAALEARRPVFMVRLEDRTDPRGFKELAWSGLSREQLRRQLARYRITNTAVAGLQRIRRKNPPD